MIDADFMPIDQIKPREGLQICYNDGKESWDVNEHDQFSDPDLPAGADGTGFKQF